MQDAQVPDKARFADFVHTRRSQLGLSREQVANALNKGCPTVKNVERGRAPVRMIAQYAMLAQVLQVSIADLLGAFGYDVAAPFDAASSGGASPAGSARSGVTKANT